MQPNNKEKNIYSPAYLFLKEYRLSDVHQICMMALESYYYSNKADISMEKIILIKKFLNDLLEDRLQKKDDTSKIYVVFAERIINNFSKI